MHRPKPKQSLAMPLEHSVPGREVPMPPRPKLDVREGPFSLLEQKAALQNLSDALTHWRSVAARLQEECEKVAVRLNALIAGDGDPSFIATFEIGLMDLEERRAAAEREAERLDGLCQRQNAAYEFWKRMLTSS